MVSRWLRNSGTVAAPWGFSQTEQSIIELIPSHARSIIRVDNGSVLPAFVTRDCVDGIQGLKIRDSDIMIITWPKSGTTWMQYIINQVNRGQNFVDNNLLMASYNFLEVPMDITAQPPSGQYLKADKASSPRFLKSHLLLQYLPRDIPEKKPKVIYVARNPKDAAVSYYNFCLMNVLLPTYSSWEEYCDQFCKGLLPYGDWFEHVLPWWERREDPNVLFVKYEDMKKDLKSTVSRLSEFLGKSLTKDEMDQIVKKSSFEEMKENPTVNPDKQDIGKWKKPEGEHIEFMRKGVIGDWMNWFTVAQSERFDEIYKSRMEGTGLNFVFE